MKELLRKLLFGESVIKEYSTVKCNFINEQVHLRLGSKRIDVTSVHYLLCLEPIIFGAWLGKEEAMVPEEEQNCSLSFFAVNEQGKKKLLAKASLEYVNKIEEKEGTLLLFKLKKSSIYHINFLKAYFLYLKYYKKPGLSFKKLMAFVVAYSYPRKVRLISFLKDDYFNMFPMDLLGQAGLSRFFVFGLRHTNITLSKIIETKKIVVSEVSYIHKELIYQLGKHHGASPPPPERLPFEVKRTDKWNFIIPGWVENYKEIRIIKNMDLGSHMLLWGEIESEVIENISVESLYHIHFLLQLYYRNKRSGYEMV